MVSHIALPVTVSTSGALNALEQDSVDELRQNVGVILATPVGSRAEVPDFGVDSAMFRKDIPGDWESGVAEWEPRVDGRLTVGAIGDGVNVFDAKMAVSIV